MSTIKTTTLSTQGGSTVPVDTVVNGTAKAWVNFNGTGTVAIRASFNVASITDNGVGDYTVNFTTAMPDANYSLLGATGNNGGQTDCLTVGIKDLSTAPATGAVRINVATRGYVNSDQAIVLASIFR